MKEKLQVDMKERHEWLKTIQQPLLRYCLQMTSSRWEADDLVQDTMVRLLEVGMEQPDRRLDSVMHAEQLAICGLTAVGEQNGSPL